jgi:hypothetical protein
MATPPTMNSILRSILSTNLDMLADEVIAKAKAKGVTQPEAKLRQNIYNIRSDIRKKARTTAPTAAKPSARPTSQSPTATTTKPVPVTAKAAARTTAAPKPAAVAKPATSTSVSVAKSSNGVDLTGVFVNVTLVNTVVTACGGVDQARQVAEAVRACGTLEAFLQHLDLVASLRASAAE